MKSLKISIIGAGNVGTQLALVFTRHGHQVSQIFSRRPVVARRLAMKVGASAITRIDELHNDADVYFLCIPDQAIQQMKDQWTIHDRLVVHTSGATEMQCLNAYSDRTGVFYPLQTFSVKKNINFTRIPICIESNHKESQDMLFQLGRQISGNVRLIDSPTRLTIHLAAVFACNFSNYMYVLAEEILQKKGFSFSILHPLIEETSSKAIKISPFHSQTGPARRNDLDIISKHLSMLESQPGLKDIYELISNNIRKNFHP